MTSFFTNDPLNGSFYIILRGSIDPIFKRCRENPASVLASSSPTANPLQGFFLESSGAENRPLSQWDLGDFFPNLKKKVPNFKKKKKKKKKNFFFFFFFF